MADRALRGSRLGAQSYETETGEVAPRIEVAYRCEADHLFTVPFAVEADIPALWDCRVCGREAQRVDAAPPERKVAKAPRTHWDMLLERRSLSELEELLSERLEQLRGPEPARPRPARTSRKSA